MTVVLNLLLAAAATLGLAFPLVAVRELVHALVARALGFRVHRIELGSGRPLARFEAAGLPIVLGRVPAGARTLLGNVDPRAFRARLVVALATGPLTMTVGMVLAWLAFNELAIKRDDPPEMLALGLAIGAFAQLCLFVGADPSLIGERRAALPSAVKALFSAAYTERRLAELVLADRQLSRDRGLAWDATPAAIDACGFQDPVARAWRGLLAVEQEDWPTAWTYLGGLHAKLVGHPLRAIVANNGAWAATRLDDAAAWAAADADSIVALQLAPAYASFQSTRAEVLVHLGRAEEAIALLEEALRRPLADVAPSAGVWTGPAVVEPLARQDRAILLCAAARAHLAADDHERASILASDARAADPDCPAVGEIERRLRYGTAQVPRQPVIPPPSVIPPPGSTPTAA